MARRVFGLLVFLFFLSVSRETFSQEILQSVGQDNVSVLNDEIQRISRKAHNLPNGAIILYQSGSTVPFGWKKCDGTNGTPDLSAYFETEYIYIMKA